MPDKTDTNDPKEGASALSTTDADAPSAVKAPAPKAAAATADAEPQVRPLTKAELRRMRDSVSPADIARYDDHYRTVSERQDYEALLPILRRLIAAHD